MYVMPVARGAYASFESKDCSVRALANAADIPYTEAHEEFERVGRIPHQGTNQHQFSKAYFKFGFSLRGVYGTTISAKVARNSLLDFVDDVPSFKGMTLKNFLTENKEGSFILIMRGHAFAVVDGDLIDKNPIKENTRISIVFEKC